MFTKKVNYGKSFHLGFHEAEKTFERPRAALSVAKSRSEEEAKRLQSVGDDDVFEGEVYGRCTDDHHNDDDIDVTKGVTFDGKNNDISIATEGKVRHKFYDEAGIEIEDDGIFDKGR
eukprot:UN13039